MKKAKILRKKIIKNNRWIALEFSYKKSREIADDIRFLADINPDFENTIFELGVLYLLTGKGQQYFINKFLRGRDNG